MNARQRRTARRAQARQGRPDRDAFTRGFLHRARLSNGIVNGRPVTVRSVQEYRPPFHDFPPAAPLFRMPPGWDPARDSDSGGFYG